MIEEHKCAICEKVFEKRTSLFRHLRTHNITAEEYVLKHELSNTKPKCACSCGEETAWHVARKGFNEFVHGHHMVGTQRSEETKRKIGKKNSINMKEWWSKQSKGTRTKAVQRLRAGITPEVEVRRKKTLRQTYANMTDADKQKFSDHATQLWAENRELMMEARSKAATTWKERYENDEYDFEKRNQKISETVTQLYIDGGFQWATGTYTSKKCDTECFYRSSWELEFMVLLDASPVVVSWQYEPFFLRYQLDGIDKRYIPDFIVQTDDEEVMVEVKPHSLRETDFNSSKRQAALDHCSEHGLRYIEWASGDGDPFLCKAA